MYARHANFLKLGYIIYTSITTWPKTVSGKMSSDSSSDILSDNEEVSQQSSKDVQPSQQSIIRPRHGEKKA
jgi:hypothetical protein